MPALISADDFNTRATTTVTARVRADDFNVAAVVDQAPVAITNLTASGFDSSALVAWTSPAGFDPATITYAITAVSGSVTRSYSETGLSTIVLASLTNTLTWTISVTPSHLGDAGPVSTTTATPSSAAGPASGTVINPIASPPLAPVLVSLTASDASIQAFWTAPTDNGGSSLTSYLIAASDGINVPTQVIANSAALKGTIAGLTNSIAYTVTVAARNTAGQSSFSNSLTATPTSGLPPVDPPPDPDPGPPPVVIVPTPNIFAFYPAGDPHAVSTGVFAPTNWAGL